MILVRIFSFSSTISTPIEQDSIVSVKASDLKYANLIFVEHKKLLIDNTLLLEQVNNFTELNFQLEQIDTLRVQQLEEYRKLTESYSNQIEDLNKEIKKKNAIVKGWQIGGITVSVGLILFLLLK